MRIVEPLNARRALFLSLILATTLGPAATADEAVGLFAQQPAMVGASLSPDGTRIAFLSSIDGRYNLVIERFRPEFERAIVAPGEQLDFEWVKWVNNDRLALSASYSARRDLVETTETRLLSVDGRGEDLTSIIKPATRVEIGSRVAKELPAPQIQDAIVDWLPSDPETILVSVDADFNGEREVRRVNVTDGDYDEPLGLYAKNRNWIADHDGEIRLGWELNGSKGEVLFREPGGEWRRSRQDGWLESGFVPIVFSDQPNAVLAIGPNDDGMAVVRKVQLDSGEFLETVFEHESVDVDGIVIDETTGMPVGVGYTEHLPKVVYFDEAFRRLQATVDKAMPDTTNQILSTSTGHRQILIHSFSDTNPGSYYIWDRDERSVSHYLDSMDGLDDSVLSPVQPVEYEARDGWTIPAYLTLPRDVEGRDLPTIVLPHGGPHTRDDKRYWFLSQFLASRGYAVLQPNFRGSSGYGQSFAKAGRSEWGGKMQDDVTDGTRWLVDQGIADPDRICIVGWSYGGYAAAMGAIKSPDLYRCAASINGVLNLPAHIQADKQYQGGHEWTEHMGLNGESAKSVSPYHQAQGIDAPMLIIQSVDDTRVHKEQGRGMEERLRDLGKPVEYIEIGFGGHSMQNVDGRRKILASLNAFLTKHIGDSRAVASNP